MFEVWNIVSKQSSRDGSSDGKNLWKMIKIGNY